MTRLLVEIQTRLNRCDCGHSRRRDAVRKRGAWVLFVKFTQQDFEHIVAFRGLRVLLLLRRLRPFIVALGALADFPAVIEATRRLLI